MRSRAQAAATDDPDEVLERIDGDAGSIATQLSKLGVTAVVSVTMVLGMITLVAIRDLTMLMAFMAFCAVSLVTLWLTRTVAVPHWRRERTLASRCFGLVESVLISRADLRANGGRNWAKERISGSLRRWNSALVSANAVSGITPSVVAVLRALGLVAVFLVGSLRTVEADMTVGEVYRFANYLILLFRPLWDLFFSSRDLQRLEASVERVHAALSRSASAPSRPGFRVPASAGAPPRITVADLSYTYPDGTRALTHASLDVAPGETVVLVGRTGGGKTTLARCLAGLLATDGRVRIARAASTATGLPTISPRSRYWTKGRWSSGVRRRHCSHVRTRTCRSWRVAARSSHDPYSLELCYCANIVLPVRAGPVGRLQRCPSRNRIVISNHVRPDCRRRWLCRLPSLSSTCSPC